jgi:bacteriocin biosynthesis cyclodehydratase domain-containing protein
MREPPGSSDRVHLISVGSFGKAVGGYLRLMRLDVLETVITSAKLASSDLWPASRVRVVAAWRPVPALCGQLDELSHSDRQPFVPLVLDSTLLQLGPVVVPNEGCCWHCWAKRNMQHMAAPAALSALWEHYDAHCEAGPLGYLEPFALMGAARVSDTIDALDSARAVPGYIWQIDLLTRTITVGRAIGIDSCPRCGLGRFGPTRGISDLKEQLKYLWTNDSSD